MRGKSCTSAEDSDAEVRRFKRKIVTTTSRSSWRWVGSQYESSVPKPYDIASGHPAVNQVLSLTVSLESANEATPACRYSILLAGDYAKRSDTSDLSKLRKLFSSEALRDHLIEGRPFGRPLGYSGNAKLSSVGSNSTAVG
jgi:hypothetical protein